MSRTAAAATISLGEDFDEEQTAMAKTVTRVFVARLISVIFSNRVVEASQHNIL